MNDIKQPPQTKEIQAKAPIRRMARIIAWSLSLGATATIFLTTLASDMSWAVMGTGLLLVLILTLLALLALLAGVGFLLFAYREFFAGRWGIWLWLGVMAGTLILSSAMTDASIAALAFAEALAAWAMAAALALGPTIWLYLRRTDHSVRLFALVILFQVWLFFTLGQALGWDELLHRITAVEASTTANPLFQTIICLSIWVFLISPLAFVWQTIVLLQRETAGASNPAGTPADGQSAPTS